MAWGLLLLGLLWRTTRYLLQFPIWGDEAMLGINFPRLDYLQLTQRLENCQIAPLLFLWGERAAYSWFGPGELAMRLLPFLAGVGALILFWHLTGIMLHATARVFAVGFLAVAIWPVSMCSLLKPYSFDLLMALVLLLPAVHWLYAPVQTRWLIWLTFLTPIALLGSYPAVLVAGGIALVLLPKVWRQGWPARCWFAAFGIALLASFALALWIGGNHLKTPIGTVDTREGMNVYWAEHFPPHTLWAFLKWFVLLTTGQMAAYPVGGSNGASIVTVLCCVAGAIWWARRREWSWLVVCTLPLVLNLVAAVLHRFPYGASGRLSQHLAPGICLLAGLGLAAFLDAVERVSARPGRGTMVVVGLFALLGLGGIVRDVVHPYREDGCLWMRRTMNQLRRQVPSNDPVVFCNGDDMECVFRWYWLTERKRIIWYGQLPPVSVNAARLWGFHTGEGADAACQRLADRLLQQGSTWHLAKRIPYCLPSRDPRDPPTRCELFCFRRSLAPEQMEVKQSGNGGQPVTASATDGARN
jgi:hypothetical protein